VLGIAGKCIGVTLACPSTSVNQDPDGLISEYVGVRFEERSSYTETYGFAGSQGVVNLDGVLIRPNTPSRTLLFFMHPTTALHILPVPRSLARLGFHVLCGQNRYTRNDTSLIFEKVLLDYGAFIRHAKERLGYEKVVLFGWSGGGPLATFYQAEAENPTITHTPAGDPVDIRGAGLLPGDAIVFQAGSISRARILAESIDPSVRNELNPDDRVRDLDLYDPANPNRPPYDDAYVATFRDAQRARMQRITGWAWDQLRRLRQRGGAEIERCFLTHRTMADPRWLDASVDHNDRQSNWCVSGIPEAVNSGPVGFGRFSTLRSWLSQWSTKDTRADAVASVTRISAPLLAIENSADEAAPASHIRDVFDASRSPDKTHIVVTGANHYYRNQPALLANSSQSAFEWIIRRNIFPDG
jgi:pimeloyl-ACP methyl ester carboxylesterase